MEKSEFDPSDIKGSHRDTDETKPTTIQFNQFTMEQFEEKYQLIKQFYSEHITNDLLIKIGQSTAILFVVIVSQYILHSVVTTIDSIPVVNGLLEVVGLYTFIVFSKNNLITSEQRTVLINKVRNNFTNVINQGDS